MRESRVNLEEENKHLIAEIKRLNDQLKRLRKTNSRLRRQSRSDKEVINKLRDTIRGKEKQHYRNGRRGTIKQR